MKNKIIASILIVCFIFTLFTLISSASDTTIEYDSEDFDLSTKGEWKQLPDGQYYNSEFEKYIDVEEYVSKARSDGYEHMQLITVEEFYSGQPDAAICLYLYNPDRKPIPINEPYGVNNNCGSIIINDSYNFMSLECNGAETSHSSMFYRVFVPLDSGLHSFIVDREQREYDIKYIEFALYSSYNDLDEGVIDSVIDKLAVNTVYSFTGFNADKRRVVEGYSSPYSDLSIYLDLSVAQLKEFYPIDGNAEASVVFFYEEDYGSEDYALYLYLYNPRLLDYKRLSVFMYHNNMFTGETFDLVNSEGALYKYRMKYPPLLGLGEDQTVREYFISGIYTYNSAMKFIDALSFEAYFMYSSVDTAHVVQSRFEYDFSDLMIDAPESAGNGTYMFTKGEKYLLTFESSKLVEYTVIPIDDCFRVSDQGECWVEFEILKDVSMLEFKELSGVSLFPYAKTPEVAFTFSKISDSASGTTSGGSISTGSHIANSSSVHYATVMLDDVTAVKDAVYLKANIDEEINLKGHYTYYRLDSSATAVNNYQTLSTLYFALPNKYLEAENVPIYDRYVSAVELAYSSAMCQPIIVGNASNGEVREFMDLMGYSTGKIDDNSFLGSGRELNPYLGGSFDYTFGNESYINSHFDYEINYPYVPYWACVDEGWDEFDEVLTTDEVSKIIQSKMLFETDLKDSQYVLNFDDTKTLSSFKDMSWENLVDSFGLLRAIQYKLFDTDQDIMDSIENIKCIETLTGADISKALSLDDASFSDTYYVALSDVPYVKDQMSNALDNNESFVFVRFDVFDYIADGLYGYSGADYIFDGSVSKDFSKDLFFFQTKYYQGLEVLSLATTNSFSTKIYNVTMPPIDTSGGGATSPDPIDPGQFNSPSIHLSVSNWDWLFTLLSLVLIIPVVILIVIFIKWIFKPLVDKGFKNKRE